MGDGGPLYLGIEVGGDGDEAQGAGRQRNWLLCGRHTPVRVTIPDMGDRRLLVIASLLAFFPGGGFGDETMYSIRRWLFTKR